MASNNPLFNQEDADDEKPSGYVLKPGKKKVKPTKTAKERQAAANMVRSKLEKLYEEEPGLKKELSELDTAKKPLSKHQKFLKELQEKSTSVAEIQIKWHEYYAALPEEEKHEVWQEFYTEQARHSRYASFTSAKEEAKPEPKAEKAAAPEKPKPEPKKNAATVGPKQEIATASAAHKRIRDARKPRDIKQNLKKKVAANRAREKKSIFHSLGFGLVTGGFVLLVMLFGLFNEMVIAPFIQPSRHVSATPIILNSDSVAADGTSKVIIPKINVEIPVDYNVPSMEESVIQKGLEEGVIHYPTTVKPGQQGNAAFFGHSSNNIFNKGRYKFAFVLLSQLEPGDMFYMTYDKKVYAYKVYEKKIVNPDEVWILNPVEGKTATAALITCDPPGTTLHRLVVWGEQISPDPAGNAASTQQVAPASSSKELTSPPVSLWGRFTNWLF